MKYFLATKSSKFSFTNTKNPDTHMFKRKTSMIQPQHFLIKPIPLPFLKPLSLKTLRSLSNSMVGLLCSLPPRPPQSTMVLSFLSLIDPLSLGMEPGFEPGGEGGGPKLKTIFFYENKI